MGANVAFPNPLSLRTGRSWSGMHARNATHEGIKDMQ